MLRVIHTKGLIDLEEITITTQTENLNTKRYFNKWFD